jgi:hypothetical protein
MSTGLSLLQSHPKTLSKWICSLAHTGNFMETPQTLQKYIFIPTASHIALQNPPLELRRNAKRAANYIEPTQTLSKINNSPTTF